MKLYAYKTSDGRYLAEMENYSGDRRLLLGAVIPGTHGNYYKHLCIGARKKKTKFSFGADEWLNWLKTDGIPNGMVLTSGDFEFDIDDVKVVVFQEVS